MSSRRIRIRPADDADLERMTAFLRQHEETSLFLASNLTEYGLRLTESMNSGNFRLIEDDDRIRAVFCLTRRGNLLAESGRNIEFADAILTACDDESLPIEAVVGEWTLASALWQRLLDSGRIVDEMSSKERLYRLCLDNRIAAIEPNPNVRRLRPGDFEAWHRLNEAYFVETGFPQQGSIAQRRAAFADKAEAGHWWGYVERGELLAIAGLNARHEKTGQVGGVYTVESRRRQGLARTLMRSLIADGFRIHELSKLILFTSDASTGAPELYESLGFEPVGDFALLFGKPVRAAPAD